jgi:hypothetical protein
MSNIVEYDGNFKFVRPKNRNISDLKFYSIKYNEGEGERKKVIVYAIWLDNGDKGIYLSLSINSGENFSREEKVMNTSGNIRDLQILAKHDQFVIALIETIDGQESKRAVSGWLNIQGENYSFKPCTSHKTNGELINIFLSFNGNESIDHMITRTGDGMIHEITMGHACSVKELKNMKITTVRL